MNIFRTHQLPGRTVVTENGQEYLHFSGTDYLGMGHNADFQHFLLAGFAQYGNHYGSSRNGSLRLGVYESTEKQLAAFVGAPASLIVSSGMWAGQLVMKMISGFTGSTATYHYAPRVHPALCGEQHDSTTPMEGCWNDWASSAVDHIMGTPAANHIICTDAIGSPWVEDYDFTIFKKLSHGENIWLIVDDSHNLGVRGSEGNGIFRMLRHEISVNLLVVTSLNKALGIPGGAVFGNREHLEVLRSSPWFAGASPPAPAYIHTLQRLLENQSFEIANRALKDNIHYFNTKMEDKNLFTSVEKYPVFCSRDVRLFEHLLRNNIMASCFSYPSPADRPVTRLAINALHQKKDLDQLAEICMKF